MSTDDKDLGDAVRGEAVTWYEIGYRGEIVPVEVVKETAQMLVVRRESWGGKPEERRVAKGGYFRTEADAIGHLVLRARKNVRDAEQKLAVAKSRRGDLRAKYPAAPEWNTPE